MSAGRFDPAVRTLLLGLAVALPGRGIVAQTAAGDRQDSRSLGSARPAVDLLHGIEVIDPFRWLEDMDAPGVREWVHVRDGLARSFAARNPRRTELRTEIESIGTRKVVGAPVRRGGRLLFSRFDPTGPDRAISVAVVDESGVERPILQPDAFRRQTGETPLRFFPDQEGRRLAVSSSRSGEVWERVRLVDVDGAAAAPAGFELPELHGTLASVVWTPAGDGFYYEAYRRGAEGTVEAPVVRYHRIGTNAADDAVVYAPDREDVFLTLSASPGSPHLFIAERIAAETPTRILRHPIDDPSGRATPLALPPATYVFAGTIGDRVWFRTDHDAPNGKIVVVDLADRSASYREVVPEAPFGISSWIGVAPVGAVVVGGRLLVTYVERGRTVPRLFSLEGEPLGDVPLPYEGSVWSGWVGTEDDSTAFYSLSGLADPGTVYALDIAGRRSAVFRAPDLPYDPGDILTEYVSVPARDGAEIPVFVVRHADTPLDGTAPLVLYGYGFAGWNAAPYFYPLMAALVRRGAVWAVAAVRGDGGYGSDWHLAGRRRNKPVAIADFVDVSRWLVSEGYTSADRLVANGSSAGGTLVSAAVIGEPDLYRAMILDYPLVDVLRYDRFGNASGWVPEYGTASDPDDFDVLRRYAPLQQIEAGKCYPATFLAPGENDGRTPPFHAYKLTAALEAADGCEAPVLLRVSWGAGHASGADLTRSLDNWADQAAFLDAVLPAGALR